MDWLDLLAVQGTLKSLLQHHSSKASVLRCSAFFMVQFLHPYMTTGKTTAWTRQTFVSKVMSLFFNMQSRIVIDFLPRRWSPLSCMKFEKNTLWFLTYCLSFIDNMIIINSVTFTELKLNPYHTVYSYFLKELKWGKVTTKLLWFGDGSVNHILKDCILLKGTFLTHNFTQFIHSLNS